MRARGLLQLEWTSLVQGARELRQRPTHLPRRQPRSAGNPPFAAGWPHPNAGICPRLRHLTHRRGLFRRPPDSQHPTKPSRRGSAVRLLHPCLFEAAGRKAGGRGRPCRRGGVWAAVGGNGAARRPRRGGRPLACSAPGRILRFQLRARGGRLPLRSEASSDRSASTLVPAPVGRNPGRRPVEGGL